jgi:hypothetical protein
MRLRYWLCAVLATALTSLLAFAAGAHAAGAHVLINVDKSSQQMTVAVDGVPRYRFAVSTGRPGLGTPSGTFHPQRLEPTWFSKEYYNSPMPHSIFFHGGFAIHGSYEISQLGGPASHGCIRLHPDNAATLYALVQRQGMEATTIVVSGEATARQRTPSEGEYPPAYGQPTYPPAYEQPTYPPPYGQRPAPYYPQSPGFYYPQQPRGYYNNGYY